MSTRRSAQALRPRRHAARPRPWAQFPWTLLGMAFITALFLASYQAAGSVPTGLHPDQRPSYGDRADR